MRRPASRPRDALLENTARNCATIDAQLLTRGAGGLPSCTARITPNVGNVNLAYIELLASEWVGGRSGGFGDTRPDAAPELKRAFAETRWRRSELDSRPVTLKLR